MITYSYFGDKDNQFDLLVLVPQNPFVNEM